MEEKGLLFGGESLLLGVFTRHTDSPKRKENYYKRGPGQKKTGGTGFLKKDSDRVALMECASSMGEAGTSHRGRRKDPKRDPSLILRKGAASRPTPKRARVGWSTATERCLGIQRGKI